MSTGVWPGVSSGRLMSTFMTSPMAAPMTIQIPTPIQFCIFYSARGSRA